MITYRGKPGRHNLNDMIKVKAQQWDKLHILPDLFQWKEQSNISTEFLPKCITWTYTLKLKNILQNNWPIEIKENVKVLKDKNKKQKTVHPYERG